MGDVGVIIDVSRSAVIEVGAYGDLSTRNAWDGRNNAFSNYDLDLAKNAIIQYRQNPTKNKPNYPGGSARESGTCNVCGTKLLRAVYGLPTREVAHDASVKLMGCLIDGEMPKWFCPECDQGRN